MDGGVAQAVLLLTSPRSRVHSTWRVSLALVSACYLIGRYLGMRTAKPAIA